MPLPLLPLLLVGGLVAVAVSAPAKKKKKRLGIEKLRKPTPGRVMGKAAPTVIGVSQLRGAIAVVSYGGKYAPRLNAEAAKTSNLDALWDLFWKAVAIGYTTDGGQRSEQLRRIFLGAIAIDYLADLERPANQTGPAGELYHHFWVMMTWARGGAWFEADHPDIYGPHGAVEPTFIGIPWLRSGSWLHVPSTAPNLLKSAWEAAYAAIPGGGKIQPPKSADRLAALFATMIDDAGIGGGAGIHEAWIASRGFEPSEARKFADAFP